MSPYPGEEPLGLAFAVIPLILAAIIFILILWRMIPELIALRRFRDEAPDWRVLRQSPELEREIEALYIARRALRSRLDGDAQAREAALIRFDALLHRAVAHAVHIIQGEEGVDAAAERAALDVVKAELMEAAGAAR
jgi:hypothetical protein